MRYVNLHKRNNSKFHFIAKRVALTSMFCIAIAAVIAVPLTARANNVQALDNNNNIIEVDNDYLGNDVNNALNAK